MGRFYRTSSATPVDYMYRVNAPLMQAVSEATDKYINQYLANVEKEKALGTQFEYAPQDTEKAQRIMQKYAERADSVTDAIHKDPANWMNQRTALEGLTKDLYKQYTTGEVSKYTANAARRNKVMADADKMAQLYIESGGTKGQKPEWVEAFKQSWDEGFKGTNYDPNQPNLANVYRGGSVPMYQDIPKMMEEAVAKIKADKSFNYTETDEGAFWRNKTTNKMELLTPERIASVAMGVVGPEQYGYLQQLASVGILDKNTFTGEAYDTPQVARSTQEQKTVDFWKDKISKTKNKEMKESMEMELKAYTDKLDARTEVKLKEGNYFAPTLSRLINTYRVNNPENKTEREVDSAKTMLYQEGRRNWEFVQNYNYRIAKDYADAIQHDKEFNQRAYNDRVQNSLALWKLNHPTGTGTGLIDKAKSELLLGGKGPTTLKFDKEGNIVEVPAGGGDIKFPMESQKSSISTTDFNSKMIYDPVSKTDVPFYSRAGQAVQINSMRGEERRLLAERRSYEEAIKTPGLSSKEIERYQTLLQQNDNEYKIAKRLHDDATRTFAQSVDAVMNDSEKAGTPLSKDEKTLWSKYSADNGKSAREQIATLEKRADQLEWDAVHHSAGFGKEASRLYKEAEFLTAQAKGIKVELKDYQNVRKKFMTNTENWFTNIRNHSIDNGAIQTSQEDSYLLSDMLLEEKGLSILNDVGRSANDVKLEAKGLDKDLKLTFTGNNLQDYLTATGAGLHVTHIGNSSVMGDGNGVAEIQIDGVAGKYYVPLNSNLRNKIGSYFSKSENSEVAAIGADLSDIASRSIRSQMTRPSILPSEAAGRAGLEYPVVVPVKGGSIELKVTEYTNSSGTKEYYVAIPQGGKLEPLIKYKIDAKGKIVLDTDANRERRGWFASQDEVVYQYKLHQLVANQQ